MSDLARVNTSEFHSSAYCIRILGTVSHHSNLLLRVNGTIDRRIQGTVDTHRSS